MDPEINGQLTAQAVPRDLQTDADAVIYSSLARNLMTNSGDAYLAPELPYATSSTRSSGSAGWTCKQVERRGLVLGKPLDHLNQQALSHSVPRCKVRQAKRFSSAARG